MPLPSPNQVLEEGNGELLFNGYEVSGWEDKKVLDMDGDSGCIQC